jgi:dTMP kinase
MSGEQEMDDSAASPKSPESPVPSHGDIPGAPARRKKYLGRGLPYTDLDDLLLKNWLQIKGFGVLETGWTRSQLVGPTIDLAKAGHAMNNLTWNLLYTTDFADRLEHEIIPGLRSGFVVLADRYYYTALARAAVRHSDIDWVRSLYGFAIEPDLVIYLQVDVDTLFKRVIMSSGLEYWEAGMDQHPGSDPYESFRKFQSKLIREFNKLSREFGFTRLDARGSVGRIQVKLRKYVADLLNIELTREDRAVTAGA